MLWHRVSAYPNVVFASSSADALAAPAIADWISVRQLPPLPAFKFRHTQTHFRPVIAMSSACIFVKKNLTFVIFDVTWCTNFNYFINLNFCVMENLLLQTKEYVKELMVYRFKSVIPSLEKTDNFPILVNDFMDKGILLWLWILPDGRAIYFSNNKKFGILIKCPDNIEVISSNFSTESFKIYDAVYWRRVYDKTKDDGKSFNTCQCEGFVVEFLYKDYAELLAMQYVEALDCKKREKSTEKQTVFSKRQLLANCENKPFKLRIDGFLLSEDYEKVADFIKKHEGTTTPPKIEEYEKDPWIKNIFDTFRTAFLAPGYLGHKFNMSLVGLNEDNIRHWQSFACKEMQEIFLEKGSCLCVLSNAKASPYEREIWSVDGNPKVIYRFPAVKNLETLIERQKDFFAKEKSAQEIREFYEKFTSGFIWRTEVDMIISGHDENGNPQFLLL